MNILKRELRAGLKAFIFWSIGLFLLCFVGIIKYQSYTASGSMMELISAFPRIVLAVMGAVGVDIGTLSGYTALLFYYVLICAVIYAVHLGSSAVTRESIDKTYEFVFTKPCSRARVLAMKLAAAYVYLLLFCALNAVFALMAVAYLKTGEDIAGLVALLALSVFVIGFLFVALAAFFAAVANRPEKGTLYGNLAFLYAFILGVIYNMLEKPGLLRLIAPFNYFTPPELVDGRLDPLYAAIAAVLAAILLVGAFRAFDKKDMT
jgi:ABC-2 type transport system permease protein